MFLLLLGLIIGAETTVIIVQHDVNVYLNQQIERLTYINEKGE